MTEINGIYPDIPYELIPHELLLTESHESHESHESQLNESIKEYQPLVMKVVRIHKHPDVDISDAISIANIALMRAIKLYNPSRGIQFNTYAIASMKYELWHLKPTADECEVPIEKLKESSLSYRENYTIWIKELIVTKLSILPPRERDIVERSFGIDRDAQTQREIAAELGISGPRVFQLKTRALIQLKRVLQDSLTPIPTNSPTSTNSINSTKPSNLK